MLKTDMQRMVEVVCDRAQKQGCVSPQEVRDALARAGLPEGRWLEVVSLAGDMLRNRDGCFYYAGPASGQQRRRRRLSRAVRQLIRSYRSSVRDERRRQGRFDFVHPVQVRTEDGRTFTLLSCDLSTSGIRLVAPFSLLGKKIWITIPGSAHAADRCFYVQVVWSSLIGEGLYENGGSFLRVDAPATTESSHFSVSPVPVGPHPSGRPLPHGQFPMLLGAAPSPRPR